MEIYLTVTVYLFLTFLCITYRDCDIDCISTQYQLLVSEKQNTN